VYSAWVWRSFGAAGSAGGVGLRRVAMWVMIGRRLRSWGLYCPLNRVGVRARPQARVASRFSGSA
jgi:hypothetical protein